MGAYDCDCINNLEYDRREQKQKEQSQSTTSQLNDGARSTARSTDLIDRQDAIDAANDWYEGLICGSINGLIKRLNALPPAQPERRTGKWMPDNRAGGGFWVCSCCKFPSEAFAANVLYKFCPNCGADMRGEQDG